MSRHHILFIASWYPDKSNPTHGIFNRLFVEAAARNNNVSVLFVNADEGVKSGSNLISESEPRIFTVRVYYPGSDRRRSVVNRMFQYFRRIRATEKGFELIRKKNGVPDLVHLNVIMPAGAAALFLSRKYNLPLVINEGWTGYAPEDGRYRGFVTKYITGKVVSRAKVLLPVTAYLSDLMQGHGLNGRYQVVPNVVDTACFAPAQVKAAGENFRFIHVSALDDSQKNVSGILRAFAEALKRRGDLELMIAGDGPDGPQLKELARSLHLSGKVDFVGKVNPRELAGLFQRSDYLVMFSNYETFCVVVPEAMSCGIPVITSDAGGITSYLPPSMGVIIPKRDEAALTGAMLNAADKKNAVDPGKLRDFVLGRFSMEVVAASLQGVYESVLGK